MKFYDDGICINHEGDKRILAREKNAQSEREDMAGIKVATFYLVVVFSSMLVLGLYIIGAARYLTNFEENTCEMTYMFEYPQYVRIALKSEIEERYPRYGLYIYGEGFVTEKHRRMKFSGIPVLFVPGNAGSHEQVRSLASVSLRKSIDDRTPFHFDYFAVSLAKDYSALYGGVLEDQTTYVSLCIRKILDLYGGKVEKIVLIGHSMGGIVAKAALLESRATNGNETVASILLTLASPHKPIFLPDRTIAQYYQKLDHSMRNLAGTSLVSIAGGPRDILVSHSQTIETSADLNIVTSGIPSVWRSTDHLCILWCKQFVMTIVRALFDCVDSKARPLAITSDEETIKRALSYHLTSRIAGKRLHPYEDRIKFEGGGEWIERIEPSYTWTGIDNVDGANRTVFLMIRLGGGGGGGETTSYDSIGIESVNLEARDWLFACSAHLVQSNSRVCEWGWNLTNRTNLLADPTNRSRKSVDIRTADLSNFKVSHVVVRIPVGELRKNRKSATAVKIHVDLYKRSERTIRPDADGLAATFFRPIGLLFPNPRASAESSRGHVRYYASLDGTADAVSVEIEPVNDDSRQVLKVMTSQPQATIELLEDSRDRGDTLRTSQVRTFAANNEKPNGEFSKKRAVMYLARKKNNGNAMLRITLGPEYSYRMTIRRAGIVDRIACSVRDRWPIVYPIVVSLCLVGIASRLDDSTRTNSLVAVVGVVGATSLDIIAETLVALGLVHTFAITAFVLVIFSGSVVRNVTARFLARIVAMPSLWFDWLFSGFERLPILSTFILISLISATCGAIAILISVPLYFLKLTRIYDEYLEELLMASLRQFLPASFSRKQERRERRKRDRGSNEIAAAAAAAQSAESRSTLSTGGKPFRDTIFDNLLLFVTWSFASIPAIPSALVWAKNFRYETRLSTEDPAFMVSWVVLTFWGTIGLVEIPTWQSQHCPKRRKLCGNLLRLAASIIVYAVTLDNPAFQLWLVPPIVALAVSSLGTLSMFPGKRITPIAIDR